MPESQGGATGLDVKHGVAARSEQRQLCPLRDYFVPIQLPPVLNGFVKSDIVK